MLFVRLRLYMNYAVMMEVKVITNAINTQCYYMGFRFWSYVN